MRWVKFVLIIILGLAIFDMPYYYYEIMKFTCMIGFGILAYNEWGQNDKKTILWIVFALLINPYLKLQLEKNIWSIIDILIIIVILILTVKKQQLSRSNIKFITIFLIKSILGVLLIFYLTYEYQTYFNNAKTTTEKNIIDDLNHFKIKLEASNITIEAKQKIKNKISNLYWKEKNITYLNNRKTFVFAIIISVAYILLLIILHRIRSRQTTKLR
jgi:hypothetical protein